MFILSLPELAQIKPKKWQGGPNVESPMFLLFLFSMNKNKIGHRPGVRLSLQRGLKRWKRPAEERRLANSCKCSCQCGIFSFGELHTVTGPLGHSISGVPARPSAILGTLSQADSPKPMLCSGHKREHAPLASRRPFLGGEPGVGGINVQILFHKSWPYGSFPYTGWQNRASKKSYWGRGLGQEWKGRLGLAAVSYYLQDG